MKCVWLAKYLQMGKGKDKAKKRTNLLTKQSNLKKTHPHPFGWGRDVERVQRQLETSDTATSACIGDSDENGYSPEDDWTRGATGSYNN